MEAIEKSLSNTVISLVRIPCEIHFEKLECDIVRWLRILLYDIYIIFLVTPGKYNKLRIYYLSWLKNKIVKGEEVSRNYDAELIFNFYHWQKPILRKTWKPRVFRLCLFNYETGVIFSHCHMLHKLQSKSLVQFYSLYILLKSLKCQPFLMNFSIFRLKCTCW